MAGLLDALNTDEARLGLGLLAAGGYSPTPMSFGQRVSSAFQGMDARKQDQLKSKLMQSQLDENASQAALRQQQLAMSKRQMDMQNSLLGFGAPAQGSAMSAGMGGAPSQVPHGDLLGTPQTAQQPQQPQQAQGGLDAMSKQYGIPAEALKYDLVFNGGKGIAEMVAKRGTPDMQVSNGYAYDKNKIGAGYLPSMTTSTTGQTSMTQIGSDGMPIVSAPRGALETYGAYKAADAGMKPIKVYNPATGREEYTSEAAVVGAPTPNRGEAGMRVAAQGNMGPDPAAIQRELAQATADLGRVTDPSSKAQLQAYIVDLQGQAQRAPAAGNMAAGPSAQEKLSNEAGGKINETWLKTSYEPVKISGDAANDMLTNVQVARQSMRAMPGGTGWGAEAKATGAAILSSLGVAPKNAELYASNAQTFQSASMSNLQTVLNAAKGPQTEGDADRAGKTFAQLKNTPQANEFILDLSEAKAQRDQMKAQFYEQALPIARAKGDLQEVDREWRKRSPSVFNMPSMKKWGAK